MNAIIREALQIPSVKRTLTSLMVLSSLVVAAPLANLTAYAAQAHDNGCFRNNTANATLTESGNTITAKFTVPKNCDHKETHRVSLVVYTIKDCNWEHKINNQYIYSSKTVDVKVGTHTVSTSLPNHNYQADLVKGNPVNVATGAEQNHRLAAKVGRQGVGCTTKTPVTPGKTTPTTPGTPATVAPQGGPAVSAEPTALVNTGPGEVVAAFAGTSVLGSLVYHFLVRRRLGLNV